MQPILILADQLAHIFATGAKATAGNLLVNKRLQRIGEGDVHRAHARILDALAKFGKPEFVSQRPASDEKAGAGAIW